MTPKEAIKKIQARIDTDFLNGEPFPTELEMAIEALEKQATSEETSDKYRWHDLRKNPEDLPTHTKTVEVELWSEFLGIYHDHDSIHSIEDGMWMSYPYGGNKWGKVIGWREIEPMEGE